VYNSLSDALILHIMETVKNSKERVLLISDDMCSCWRKNVDQKLVDTLISTSRHLGEGLSFVFLSQSIVQLPTSIRRNTDVFLVWGCCAYAESQLVWQDISTVNKKDFMKMFRQATSKQFGFLVCCNHKGQLRFYQSFGSEFTMQY